jgi:general bacterial porin, GBP family
MKLSKQLSLEHQTKRSSRFAACALLCAALPFSLHAQTANVTLFGVVDVGIESAKGGSGSVLRVASGQAQSSRWGIRGTEDLGGGLKANFWLENGFAVDTGALGDSTRLFQRRATVGLSGNWGSIDAGRWFRPEARAVFDMDPFDAGGVASPPDSWSSTTFRAENQIQYETPNFGGVVGRLMYAFGETANNGAAKRDIGGSLHYRGGPVYVAYAYDELGNAAGTDKRKWHTIGGNYDLGVAKIYGAFRTRKEASAALDERSYWLGVAVPLGAVTLRGTVGKVDDRTAPNKDASGFGLGAEYAFSKRTDTYFRFGRVSNKNGATFSVGNGIVGNTPRSLVIGIRHRF